MAYGVDVPTDLAYRFTTEAQPKSSLKDDSKSSSTPADHDREPALNKSPSAGASNGVGGSGRLVLEETVQEGPGGALTAVRVRDATTAPDGGASTASPAPAAEAGGWWRPGRARQPQPPPSQPPPSQPKPRQHKQRRGERHELRGASQGRRGGHSGDGTVK
jgi:hypothetical protein